METTKEILLSVTLATHNEEDNLERCLKSVEMIADEIVIVDGESTDKTCEIAHNFGAKVISTSNKANFHINKQMANDEARGEWILQLDADEVISGELAEEIKHIVRMTDQEIRLRKIPEDKDRLFRKQQEQVQQRDGRLEGNGDDVVAFFVPRSNLFLGRFMRHTGMYPDGVIRLFKNGKARLPCKSVHEQYELDGKVSWLINDMIHYDSPTFERYLARNNRYSSLFAKELADQQIPITAGNMFYYAIWKPKLLFLSLFLRHGGYKDGWPGLAFSFFSGMTWTHAWIKYWEMTKINRLK